MRRVFPLFSALCRADSSLRRRVRQTIQSLEIRQAKKRSRKRGIIALFLGLVAGVLVLLALGLFYEIGFEGSLYLLFLALVFGLAGAGLAAIDRAAMRGAGSEALGFLIKTIIVGLGFVLVGFFILFGVLAQLFVKQRGALLILFLCLIAGGFAVLLVGQIIFAMRRGRTRAPSWLGRHGISGALWQS
jgi:F0F1-type ATP synthase assembly protein I